MKRQEHLKLRSELMFTRTTFLTNVVSVPRTFLSAASVELKKATLSLYL